MQPGRLPRPSPGDAAGARRGGLALVRRHRAAPAPPASPPSAPPTSAHRRTRSSSSGSGERRSCDAAAPTSPCPGTDPAIGGSYVAVREGDEVTLLDRGTLAPIASGPGPGRRRDRGLGRLARLPRAALGRRRRASSPATSPRRRRPARSRRVDDRRRPDAAQPAEPRRLDARLRRRPPARQPDRPAGARHPASSAPWSAPATPARLQPGDQGRAPSPTSAPTAGASR